jgi:ABC-type Fe3+ transport system permease subunit
MVTIYSENIFMIGEQLDAGLAALVSVPTVVLASSILILISFTIAPCCKKIISGDIQKAAQLLGNMILGLIACMTIILFPVGVNKFLESYQDAFAEDEAST